jgi:PleD family two-component response regulator
LPRHGRLPIVAGVTKPLALLLHDRLLPGTRLAGQLEELGWRVLTLAEPAALPAQAAGGRAMVVVADLGRHRAEVLDAVRALHAQPATAHVPVIGYLPREDGPSRGEAEAAGICLVATDGTIVLHLAQFLERALDIA